MDFWNYQFCSIFFEGFGNSSFSGYDTIRSFSSINVDFDVFHVTQETQINGDMKYSPRIKYKNACPLVVVFSVSSQLIQLLLSHEAFHFH